MNVCGWACHMAIAAGWYQKAIENLFPQHNCSFYVFLPRICIVAQFPYSIIQLPTPFCSVSFIARSIWTLKRNNGEEVEVLSTKLKVVTRGPQIEISTMGENPFFDIQLLQLSPSLYIKPSKGSELLAPLELLRTIKAKRKGAQKGSEQEGNKKAVLWHSISFFFLLTIPNSYKLLAKCEKRNE